MEIKKKCSTSSQKHPVLEVINHKFVSRLQSSILRLLYKQFSQYSNLSSNLTHFGRKMTNFLLKHRPLLGFLTKHVFSHNSRLFILTMTKVHSNVWYDNMIKWWHFQSKRSKVNIPLTSWWWAKPISWPLFNTITPEQKRRLWTYFKFGQRLNWWH